MLHLLWTVTSQACFLTALTVLRGGGLLLLTWNLSDAFLIVRLRMVLRKITAVKNCVHHSITRLHTWVVNYLCPPSPRAMVVSVGYPHYNVSLSLLSSLSSSEGGTPWFLYFRSSHRLSLLKTECILTLATGPSLRSYKAFIRSSFDPKLPVHLSLLPQKGYF